MPAITSSEHAEYLQSPRWKALREECFANCQNLCQHCDMPRWLARIVYDQDLHAHHVSYANKGTDKEVYDLDALCRRCHEIETFGRSDLRAPKSSVCGVCKGRHWNPYDSMCVGCKSIFSSHFDNILHRVVGNNKTGAILIWPIILHALIGNVGDEEILEEAHEYCKRVKDREAARKEAA